MTNKNSEGPRYIGVTWNNKNKWQIRLNLAGAQKCIATVDDPMCAALLHDLLAIQTRGFNAKTNFNYSARELIVVLGLDSLLQLRGTGYEPGDK